NVVAAAALDQIDAAAAEQHVGAGAALDRAGGARGVEDEIGGGQALHLPGRGDVLDLIVEAQCDGAGERWVDVGKGSAQADELARPAKRPDPERRKIDTMAGAQIGDEAPAEAPSGIEKGIRAGAALEAVVAAGALDEIVAVVPLQVVVARAAIKLVVSGAC